MSGGGRWSGVDDAVQKGHLKRKEPPPPPPTYSITENGDIVDQQGKVVPNPNGSNPCLAAKAASYKCVEKGGNCQDFYDVYNLCKKQWFESKAEYRKLKAEVDRKGLFSGFFS